MLHSIFILGGVLICIIQQVNLDQDAQLLPETQPPLRTSKSGYVTPFISPVFLINFFQLFRFITGSRSTKDISSCNYTDHETIASSKCVDTQQSNAQK